MREGGWERGRPGGRGPDHPDVRVEGNYRGRTSPPAHSTPPSHPTHSLTHPPTPVWHTPHPLTHSLPLPHATPPPPLLINPTHSLLPCTLHSRPPAPLHSPHTHPWETRAPLAVLIYSSHPSLVHSHSHSQSRIHSFFTYIFHSCTQSS